MSEAIISEAIKTLESFVVEVTSSHISHIDIGNVKEVVNELRMMLDFLRDKESGERIRLDHLLADLVEIAADLIQRKNIGIYLTNIYHAIGKLRKTRKRIMEFGAGGGLIKPQSVEGGDESGVVVGLEKDVQQLIGRVILNEERDLVVLRIKGMIGAGKTTLARLVYNHPAIVEKFKLRAWLSISRYTSTKEVLVKLVQQLLEHDGDGDSLLEEMDNQSLRWMLLQRLRRMSFFIVVDNLLPDMDFESFLIDLARSGHGCRLLITSRYQIPEDVHARRPKISSRYPIQEDVFYTHEMKPLDSDKSWQLFLNVLFCGDNFVHKLPKHLERKGKEMLKKCGGLPMAIIDAGRQKAKQRLEGIGWEELFDSIDLSESLKLLEPMYHELDEELKPFFLHMSFFKKNAIMREEKLEQIWASSGLNTKMASTYSLFKQSIIEVVHPYPKEFKVKRCRINPLLHELSIKKAEEEMGFEILRSDVNSQPLQSPRHRVIHCGRDKMNHSTDQAKHLVSLIFHGGGGYVGNASQSYWKSFELLKILDMEDFGVKTLSETIGTLIELRYLGLRNNYIQEIPHSFGGLKRLDVLDIALNFMVEVPDIIKEMDSLCHLYMCDVIFKKPLKVDALQNLETLTYISIYDWTYEASSMEKMTRLYKLGVEEVDEKSDVCKLFASLAKLTSFRQFTLRGFRFRSMSCLDEISALNRLDKLRLDGCLARLPSANIYLVVLVLVNTGLNEDPMPLLRELHCLEQLKLRNAYTGPEMVIRYGFPRLRVLRINELWNLRNILVVGAMPKLKQLEIMNCPYLETLPEAIGSMKDLRKFTMVTTKHIATKIRNSSLISKILEVDIIP
ncbi:disease resistance RPP8-like protein 3 [Salvia hispanica]|uniref:disease resistance RPP8-like protein 3 n=1 Tax=Salvia hispanica TaxID=49212 RepID=UPI0020097671|nr:disease resistance RPP8-like protein 3 [Salvia hispanica]